MSNLFKLGSALFLTVAMLAGCGGGSGGSDGNSDQPNKPVPANRLDWSAVPSEYNPHIDETEFTTDGFEKVKINLFGHNDDAEVVYSKDVPADTGYLRLYKVAKGSWSWPRLEAVSSGATLNLKNTGSYQCSIQIANRHITSLEGGCFVRLQVLLPVGSEIEVYNDGELITKRFIPISNEDFLEEIKKAWSEQKLAVIENFLASYKGLKIKPSLTAYELGVVIGEFPFSENKFKALRRLHSFVSDRENLEKMIESKFNYFDREEAKSIVGI